MLYEIFCKLFSVFAVLSFDVTVINTMYNTRQKAGKDETFGRVKLSPCQYLKLCVALNVCCNGSTTNAVSPEEQYGAAAASKGNGSLSRQPTFK